MVIADSACKYLMRLILNWKTFGETCPILQSTHANHDDNVNFRDATSKMSEIIDHLGQLSATAQKLSKAVTTAQRLRMSENQTIYLLADVNAGNK